MQELTYGGFYLCRIEGPAKHWGSIIGSQLVAGKRVVRHLHCGGGL